MDKIYLIKLTSGLYKVADSFPKDEPIKISLKEKANEVLADSVVFFEDSLSKKERNNLAYEVFRKINIIQVYFDVVRFQDWVDEKNFLVLEKEYERLKKEIAEMASTEEKQKEPEEIKEEKKVERKPLNTGSLYKANKRAKRILEVLKENERVQVQEIKKIFPKISKRTLRRDFDFLLNNGLVERIGEGKYTFYKIRPDVKPNI